MPDAKRDSVLIFINSKPLTYHILGSVSSTAQHSASIGYVSQTGPTVTTDVKTRECDDFDRNYPKSAG